MNPSPVEGPQDAGDTYARERGKPVPGFNHSAVQSNIIEALRKTAGFRILSELSLELNGWPCVPDICVYRRVGGLLASDIARVKEPPLTTVEILSPTQTMEEMMNKVNRLLSEGVPSVWLVIPAVRVVTIFQKDQPPLSALHGNLTDPATGITVDVGELFV